MGQKRAEESQTDGEAPLWQSALQRRTARSAMALGMLLAASSGVLHPLQPQAAQQKYLWNVTVGDSFKTFEVMVHPDWCVLHTHCCPCRLMLHWATCSLLP